VDIEAYKESAHAAFGNGSGIVIVGRTTTGCILGQSCSVRHNSQGFLINIQHTLV
jgi:hypothetical protein